MSLDAYQPCPAGIDKKIKFCCGPEILDDLAKIEDALAGDQRLGALDLCNRLLEKKPDRACLLMHKATIQLGLQELSGCRETVERLLQVAPENPSGMALLAILDCQEGIVQAAVDHLQTALEGQQGKLISMVYEAIGMVARALDLAGESLAAQTHAVFQAGASQGKDREAMMNLLEIESRGGVPLAIHGMTGLISAPAEGPLKAAQIAEFNEALRQADLGCWRRAATMFDSLAHRAADEPAAWRNLGVCRLRVLDNAGATEAFRRFAALPGVPRDDAVEAEAMAQFLREPSEIDTIPELTLTYAVDDVQALREHLLSSKRVHTIPFDPAQFREEDEPPPMGIFVVLDREVPAHSHALSRDKVPRLCGELLLYGKETDRPARAEFTVMKTADYDARVKAFLEVLGSHAGEKLSEEETGRISAVTAALSIDWRFPDDTPPDVRKRLMQEQRALSLLSIWPNLPMGVLDGRSPRQAVADPTGQVRVLAIILQMDLAEPTENPDYNKLRRSLGLGTLEPIDPTGIRVETLSPARQTRLDLPKLTDDQLLTVYRRAILTGAPRLLRGLGLEIVNRPSLDSRTDFDKAEVFDILARMAIDAGEAIDFLHKAQAVAKAKGQSPARYLLGELPFHLQRGDEQESRRVLNVLMTRHAREPGIQQALLNLLGQLGLVRTDPATGRPVMIIPSGGLPGAAPDALGAVPPPPSAAPPAQPSIWTPDQFAPAPSSSGEGKSKLWIPGA